MAESKRSPGVLQVFINIVLKQACNITAVFHFLIFISTSNLLCSSIFPLSPELCFDVNLGKLQMWIPVICNWNKVPS